METARFIQKLNGLGSLPPEEGWMMRRWAQMGKGELLGSSEFVEKSISWEDDFVLGKLDFEKSGG